MLWGNHIMGEFWNLIIRLGYAFIEPYVFGMASLISLGFSFEWKRWVAYSLIYGSLVFGLREFLVPAFQWLDGIRIVVMIILNILILKGVFKLQTVVAVLADVLFFAFLIAAESVGLALFSLIRPEAVTEILSGSSFLWRGILGMLSVAMISSFIYWLSLRKQVFLPIQYITERSENDKI